MSRMVIKLGGSLYSQPNLRAGLKQFLAKVTADHILIVPGGGEFADAVRNLDTIHGLGEEDAHELAMVSLYTASRFVFQMLFPDLSPGWCDVDLVWDKQRVSVMHHTGWWESFQRVNGAMPETWEVTTDTIAACAAQLGNCPLLLLKSVDVHPDWSRAAELGHVDAYFPKFVKEHNLKVYAMNFRQYLEELQ